MTAPTAAVLPDSRKTSVMVVQNRCCHRAVICTDSGGAFGQAVEDLGLEHHPVVIPQAFMRAA